ncbi:MAG TPA: citrate/2-methylcitrate synthase [Candidatus Limiplasma sp.]|nr:citrate/2-methylcitrate synthase [Candidatus Limiplasma sp.]HRX08659.1 citrate/2-methylcitrate synthase [Candidatus Limiplasma sp.]
MMNKTPFDRLVEYSTDNEQAVVRGATIDKELYSKYGVKRGLRDENGKGVLAGLTNISEIQGRAEVNGELKQADGRLWYRGYDIIDLVNGVIRESRFGFEEITYLLLYGELPDKARLQEFTGLMAENRYLPTNFVRDVVMKAPSADMMNSLSRSVLTLASYDSNPSDLSVSNTLRQCLRLIAVFPMLAVYGYHAFNHYEQDQSMYIHRPDPSLSAAENLLHMLRPDMKYTALEAQVLDLALILHMEHGGGNNSSFTTHVVTSSGTDTYSAIAAALASLKGPKHGGANIKVVQMMEDLKKNVTDLTDEEAVEAYLIKLLHKEAFDQKGLIYGIGHAVYSVSDPRARVFKSFVEELCNEKCHHEEYALYSMVERLAPKVITSERRIYKGVSANVDFFSGLVYSMLGIPEEMFTPIFAIARIVGWSAHRMEELINMDKIIRPAYMAVFPRRDYKALDERE